MEGFPFIHLGKHNIKEMVVVGWSSSVIIYTEERNSPRVPTIFQFLSIIKFRLELFFSFTPTQRIIDHAADGCYFCYRWLITLSLLFIETMKIDDDDSSFLLCNNSLDYVRLQLHQPIEQKTTTSYSIHIVGKISTGHRPPKTHNLMINKERRNTSWEVFFFFVHRVRPWP